MDKIDAIARDMLTLYEAKLSSLFAASVARKQWRDWTCGPRRKGAGARARKRSVYVSLPGIKRIRVSAFVPYTRKAS